MGDLLKSWMFGNPEFYKNILTSRPNPKSLIINRVGNPKQNIMAKKKEIPKKSTTKKKSVRTTMPSLEHLDNGKLEKSMKKFDKENPIDQVHVENAEVRTSQRAMGGNMRRFHGARAAMSWMPVRLTRASGRDRFGYMTPGAVRSQGRLPFNSTNKCLLENLGRIMGNSGRESSIADSATPAGYTYFGQFVDHDISLDITSTLDRRTNANQINNMRTPALDLDSLYGDGPVLDPFLYDFPTSGPSSAIKFILGTNTPVGPGGPGGNAGFSGMIQQTNFDLPRMSGSQRAVIGDPRNDENLFVSQLHHAMLKFHNATVDFLIGDGFTGDIFAEAKKMVTHHYQWAVVEDFLRRICGDAAVNDALANVSMTIGQNFRLPAEFAVAAYRFGHSMVRESYGINFNFLNESLGQAFTFVRNPNLPVFSNWAVDFNAFFDTGIPVPFFNHARKIDTVLSSGLEMLPGGSGIMAILASRNLIRGLSYGLPSGQAMANFFGITPLTDTQIKSGLDQNEVDVLESQGGILLNKTPLWFYILREADVLSSGETLGPVGAKIVADNFIKMLKRDPDSYLNVSGGFTPTLAGKNPIGTFNVEDIIVFSGVNIP